MKDCGCRIAFTNEDEKPVVGVDDVCYRLEFCPLHAAAESLLLAARRVINNQYGITGIYVRVHRYSMAKLERAIAKADGHTQPGEAETEKEDTNGS